MNIFIHFQPTAQDEGLDNLNMLREMLHYTKNNLRESFYGGANSHFFAVDLEKNSEMYATVMDELWYYINCVKGIYPELIHVKGSAIMSAPNAPAQFEGHNERFILIIQPMF